MQQVNTVTTRQAGRHWQACVHAASRQRRRRRRQRRRIIDRRAGGGDDLCCARGGERGDVGTHGKGKPPAPCVVRERANDESGMVVRLQPHTHSPGTRGEVKPVVRRGSSRSRGGRRTAQQHYDHTHDARSANDARPVNQAAGEAQRATEAAATAEKPASERA